jgi:hypothetical protein
MKGHDRWDGSLLSLAFASSLRTSLPTTGRAICYREPWAHWSGIPVAESEERKWGDSERFEQG